MPVACTIGFTSLMPWSVCVWTLDYLFEDEINDMVTQIHNVDVSGCDLQTVAMWFYLLRNHGYRVSSGNQKRLIKLLNYLLVKETAGH